MHVSPAVAVAVAVAVSAAASRSVSVVLAYLMQSQRMGLQQAYDRVKLRHSFLWPGPNASFVAQLSTFEAQLFPDCLPCDTAAATLEVLSVVQGSVPRAMLLSTMRMKYCSGGEEAIRSMVHGEGDGDGSLVMCTDCGRRFQANVMARHQFMHKQQGERMVARSKGLAAAGREDRRRLVDESKDEVDDAIAAAAAAVGSAVVTAVADAVAVNATTAAATAGAGGAGVEGAGAGRSTAEGEDSNPA